MGVDVDKMRKKYDEQKTGGGEFFNPQPGETLLYIFPCREDDEDEPTQGLPYVPVVVHYGLGKDTRMSASLDRELNTVLDHPFVRKHLKAKKLKVPPSCPIKDWLESDATEAQIDESRPQTKYLFGCMPFAHRAKSTVKNWSELEKKPQPMLANKTIFEGIMEAFFELGDISDPDAAILIKIAKNGKGRTTSYEVSADVASVRKPIKLGKAERLALKKAMADGGDCDLFRIAANLTKTPAELKAIIEGTEIDDEPDDEEDEGEVKPKKKAGKKAPPPDDDDDDEDELEDEDEPADDDEDELEEEDDEDEEPAADDDDDEDELDDEDDDEDEPPPPKKKPGKKPPGKPAAKPSKKPPADDDDELNELNDLESELDGLEEEDEEPPPRPKKTGKALAKKTLAKKAARK